MQQHSKSELAVQFLMKLNELDVDAYQKVVQERLDPEVLAIFESYCRQLIPPDESEEILGMLIHLLITGYLVSSNERKPIDKEASLIEVVN